MKMVCMIFLFIFITNNFVKLHLCCNIKCFIIFMSLPLLRFIFNCMYMCEGWVGACLDMGSSTGQGKTTAITFTLMSQLVDPQ